MNAISLQMVFGKITIYNDRFGWNDENHLASVCTTRSSSTTVEDKPTCILDHSRWETEFGRCSSYAYGSDNHAYCADDGVDGYRFSANTLLGEQRVLAKQVCPECGQCVSGTYTEKCDIFDPVTDGDEREMARNALGLSVGSQICRTGFINIGPGRCEDYRGQYPNMYVSESADRSTCENVCASNSECLGYYVNNQCVLLVASGTSFASGTPSGFRTDFNYSGKDVSTTSTIGIEVGCMRKILEGESKPWMSRAQKLQANSGCATHEDCVGESVCIENFCVAAVLNKQSARPN